uniref:Uncharacterized protein n=1 Tax=Arundo donax TaxID=35708 RepID=A0A0A9EQ56_ARUDO
MTLRMRKCPRLRRSRRRGCSKTSRWS